MCPHMFQDRDIMIDLPSTKCHDAQLEIFLVYSVIGDFFMILRLFKDALFKFGPLMTT